MCHSSPVVVIGTYVSNNDFQEWGKVKKMTVKLELRTRWGSHSRDKCISVPGWAVRGEGTLFDVFPQVQC